MHGSETTQNRLAVLKIDWLCQGGPHLHLPSVAGSCTDVTSGPDSLVTAVLAKSNDPRTLLSQTVLATADTVHIGYISATIQDHK